MNRLVLSIFPGIDLLGRGFEEEGFCVVRGPDLIWGGDVRDFHPPVGVFDGVIGGPPCQAFSRLRHLVEYNGYTIAPNMIPEYERVVREAAPTWWVMENVPAAPLPDLPNAHSLMFNNRWIGEEQNRLRRFTSNLDLAKFIDVALFESPMWAPAVMANGGSPTPVRMAHGAGGELKRKSTAARNIGYNSASYFREACRLQGLSEDFDIPGMTVAAKVRAVGNGVPIPMARAVAKAVRQALAEEAQP